jgi:hypothetical protein
VSFSGSFRAPLTRDAIGDGGTVFCGSRPLKWEHVPSAGDGHKKCPRDFAESLERPDREQTPPLGQLQDNRSPRPSASVQRLGSRICLRKGCGRSYQPRHGKQRYCQDLECLKEVRRWQAVKRQQRRREQPEVRQQRAAVERERRARQREQRCCGQSLAAERSADSRHTDGAWSRKERNSGPFCDRVGCYEKLRSCSNGQARYCGEDCRRDVARVRDRERKWLARKTPAGRFKRHLEYRARRPAWAVPQEQTADPPACNLALDGDQTVVNSRDLAESRLPCRDLKMVTDDDRETHPDCRPRPPPSS